jgi:hypothetical protein
MMTANGKPLLLVGCGILQKEIRFLIEKNRWPLETLFLDSTLHIDFDRLFMALTTALESHKEREIIVFYGACHPLMEAVTGSTGSIRTMGQNCVEMLLGTERFTDELEKGAFFLLEEWACRYKQIMTATFGPNQKIMREIIQGDRSCLLCVTTPCSGDFRAEAEVAGSLVGLPLRWMDVSLEHLEAVLRDAINEAKRRDERTDKLYGLL